MLSSARSLRAKLPGTTLWRYALNQHPKTQFESSMEVVTSIEAPNTPYTHVPHTELSTAVFTAADVYDVGKATNIKWHESKVTKESRQSLMGQKGCVLWMTGLSGSGKSTLAYTLDHALANLGKMSYVLDGDNVRHGLNKNLGFSHADREENIRRVGEVAKLFAEAGLITLVSFISPYRNDRRMARALLPEGDFIEIYMKIPLSVCEERDPKGLYKLARAGKLKGFTGIDDPYEEPETAEVVVEVAKEDGVLLPPELMAQSLIKYLTDKGFLSAPGS